MANVFIAAGTGFSMDLPNPFGLLPLDENDFDPPILAATDSNIVLQGNLGVVTSIFGAGLFVDPNSDVETGTVTAVNAAAPSYNVTIDALSLPVSLAADLTDLPLENGISPFFREVLSGADLIQDQIGGNDLVRGFFGADRIEAGAGNDLAYGNQDNDTIFGGSGADTLFGGRNLDVLAGEVGDDAIYGNFREDQLIGGDGNDNLSAGQGNDIVIGDAGNDTIIGARGFDTLTGGTGGDVFIFNYGVDQWTDLITDFNPAEGDVIQIFNSAVAGTALTFDAANNQTIIFSTVVYNQFEQDTPFETPIFQQAAQNFIVLVGGDFTGNVGAGIDLL